MNLSLYLRRFATVVGVAAAMLVGVGSIRAAALWTAAEAPLIVAPVSASTLQTQLADEQGRSASLKQQLEALESQSSDLATALTTAHERIDSESTNATALAAQLAAAKQRLAKLEATIKAAANQPPVRRVVTVYVKVPVPVKHDDHGDDGG